MEHFFRTHRRVKWAGVVVLGLLLAVVLALSLFDWNALRPPLARAITKATGRPTFIDGDLKVHPWSWNPSADVNGLRLENPSWADRRIMFGAKRVHVSVSLLRLLRAQLVLPEVELIEPVINLERDSKGRASWELGTRAGVPNHDTKPTKLPTIRRLNIEGGKLHVVDQIRKLAFSGSLVAGEEAGKKDATALQVRASGSLNDKPFRLDADGGPLLDLEPNKPYSFSTHLTASDIDLETHVTLRKAFDFSGVDASFVVSGDDLADVYYLTGLALPNTPKYRLAATLHANGNQLTIDHLKGSLGTSDLGGTIQIDSGRDRPKLTAKLTSQTLDIADLAPTLGQRAPQANTLSANPPAAGTKPSARSKRGATPAPPTDSGPSSQSAGLLLPNADLQVNRVRGMDADVTYRADSVKAPKVPITEVDLHVVLDNGLLTLSPLSFGLTQGRLTGRVQIDARQDDPVSDIDMRIEDINLSEFRSAAMKEAPLDGVILGRLKLHGTGTSVHKFAGASDGAMSVVIPHGQISEAIAELTGINVLQGLGLLVTKEQQKTDIRCGILDFKDQTGTLHTTTVYIDTSNVLITGRGDIDLHDEDIKLALQGDPKHVRLVRLRSPIELGGTLLHPSVGLNAGKLAEQAGIAAALGVLLTPAAAALAFVDPGLAKDKDCSTVLAQAHEGVQHQADAQDQSTGQTTQVNTPGQANTANQARTSNRASTPSQANTPSQEAAPSEANTPSQ